MLEPYSMMKPSDITLSKASTDILRGMRCCQGVQLPRRMQSMQHWRWKWWTRRMIVWKEGLMSLFQPSFFWLIGLMISHDTLTNPTLRIMVTFQVHQWYQQCHKDPLMLEVGSTSRMKLNKQPTISRRSLIKTYRV